jgi:hypothetical protein
MERRSVNGVGYEARDRLTVHGERDEGKWKQSEWREGVKDRRRVPYQDVLQGGKDTVDRIARGDERFENETVIFGEGVRLRRVGSEFVDEVVAVVGLNGRDQAE